MSLDRKQNWILWQEALQTLQPEVVRWRRYLHEHPELSGEEQETAAYLAEQLRAIGCTIHPVEGTGFYAILDSGSSGFHLALRTDLDALPVHEAEEHLAGHRTVCSHNLGVMHACGHDAHMAQLLAVATVLSRFRDQWAGRVYFLCEEGEETGSGIRPMLAALAEESIDAIVATHVHSDTPSGQIQVVSGPIMAGSHVFRVRIKGRGGHSSRPDLSINPIFVAGQILLNWGAAWVNQIDPNSPVTLGIGHITGGEVANVIPDTTLIEGTIRFFDPEQGEKALQRLEEIARLTAIPAGAEASLECVSSNPPVLNDPKLADRLWALAPQLSSELIRKNPWFASESFAHYRQLAPILFTLTGIQNPEVGSGAPHHNEKFEVDEGALFYASESLLALAWDLLNPEKVDGDPV